MRAGQVKMEGPGENRRRGGRPGGGQRVEGGGVVEGKGGIAHEE